MVYSAERDEAECGLGRRLERRSAPGVGWRGGPSRFTVSRGSACRLERSPTCSRRARGGDRKALDRPSAARLTGSCTRWLRARGCAAAATRRSTPPRSCTKPVSLAVRSHAARTLTDRSHFFAVAALAMRHDRGGSRAAAGRAQTRRRRPADRAGPRRPGSASPAGGTMSFRWKRRSASSRSSIRGSRGIARAALLRGPVGGERSPRSSSAIQRTVRRDWRKAKALASAHAARRRVARTVSARTPRSRLIP